MGDWGGVGLWCGANIGGDVAPSGHDLVKSAAVYDQIFDDREGTQSPRLNGEDGAPGEVTHVDLTDGHAWLGAMGHAFNHEATGATDALAAVVVEGDGVFVARDEGFVEDVEGLEEGHIVMHLDLVLAPLSFFVTALLAPNPELQRSHLHLEPLMDGSKVRAAYL